MPAAGTKHALAPVNSKQAQTGGKKADSLSCTICHVAAKPYWYGQSLGHSQGLFFHLFYALLPCMCLCLGRKCETKSLSGPHQAGFTVWAQPEKGAALIIICAIFQTVLTIGLWTLPSSCKTCRAETFLRKYNTFSKGSETKQCLEVTICSFFLPEDLPLIHGFTWGSIHSARLEFERGCQNIRMYLCGRFSEGKCVAVYIFHSWGVALLWSFPQSWERPSGHQQISEN